MTASPRDFRVDHLTKDLYLGTNVHCKVLTQVCRTKTKLYKVVNRVETEVQHRSYRVQQVLLGGALFFFTKRRVPDNSTTAIEKEFSPVILKLFIRHY